MLAAAEKTEGCNFVGLREEKCPASTHNSLPPKLEQELLKRVRRSNHFRISLWLGHSAAGWEVLVGMTPIYSFKSSFFSDLTTPQSACLPSPPSPLVFLSALPAFPMFLISFLFLPASSLFVQTGYNNSLLALARQKKKNLINISCRSPWLRCRPWDVI